MTAAGEVVRSAAAHAELERRYRRLLWAYPAGYRRAFGEEMVATLMDSAEPGRHRPTRADVADLVRGAVRQWFRLPVGRSAVVAAVLTALLLGAMGATAGSWLAWETTAALPSDSTAVQTTELVTGAPLTAPEVTRHDGWRLDRRTVQVSNPNEQGFPNWTIQGAQARLRADGWTIGPGAEYTSPDYRADGGWPASVHQRFRATRDGHVLIAAVRTPVAPGGPGSTMSAEIFPAAASWEPALILLGWLVGALVGWLLTGWASYRLRRRALPVRAAAIVLGLAAHWAVIDATKGLYRALGSLAVAEPGPETMQGAYGHFMGMPENVATTLALGLVIAALAATGRRRRTAGPTPAAT